MSLDAVRQVLLVSFLLTGCSASYASTSPNAVVLCGERLVNALHLTCNGLYFEAPRAQKRLPVNQEDGTSNEEATNDELQEQEIENQFMHFLLQKPLPMPMPYLVKRAAIGRMTRAVSDECCKRPCTYRDLRQYCHIDSTSRPLQLDRQLTATQSF
ncbi:hypothetical protein CHUAL_012649 [Chamberlinius hualienensis]